MLFLIIPSLDQVGMVANVLKSSFKVAWDFSMLTSVKVLNSPD